MEFKLMQLPKEELEARILEERLRLSLSNDDMTPTEHQLVYEQSLSVVCPRCGNGVGLACSNLNMRRWGKGEVKAGPHPQRFAAYLDLVDPVTPSRTVTP